jgi:hypothetical protein
MQLVRTLKCEKMAHLLKGGFLKTVAAEAGEYI